MTMNSGLRQSHPSFSSEKQPIKIARTRGMLRRAMATRDKYERLMRMYKQWTETALYIPQAHVRRLITSALLTVSVLPGTSPSHAQSRRPITLNYALRCHGIRRTSTLWKEGVPQTNDEKATETFIIVRHGRQLSIQVDLDQLHGDPDFYNILGEPDEGLIAQHLSGFNTLNTLTLDRTLKYGLFVQNGFTLLLEPQGVPISDIVSLTCSREK